MNSPVGVCSVPSLADAGSFDNLATAHELAWRHLWERFGLEVVPRSNGHDAGVPALVRLHLFHLLQSASLHTVDVDAGIAARGLHGEGYRGHVFWDELFVFPFLSLRFPQLSRALLMYRYRRLDQARRAAADVGLRGAMFPWQSASGGKAARSVQEQCPCQLGQPQVEEREHE